MYRLQVLTDSMEFVPLNMFGQQSNDIMLSDNQNIGGHKNCQLPKEILMVGLGNRGSRPVLIVRTDTELLIYRVRKVTLLGKDFLKIFISFFKNASNCIYNYNLYFCTSEK